MRRLASALVLTASLVFAVPAARANELCAGEFQALIAKHSEVMKQLAALKTNKEPKTFEEARANAQRACQGLAPAVASFERVQTWVNENKDFCMLPAKVVSDVAAGNASIKRNRAQACGALARLDKNRRQAESSTGSQFSAQFQGRRHCR